VKERRMRYRLKRGKVYQAESVEAVGEKAQMILERTTHKNCLRLGKEVYRTSLVVKLLAVILNKAASLDARGVGIEMEADKPGWCDSLNGLPALFGSSLTETLELKRVCRLLDDAINTSSAPDQGIRIPEELFRFFEGLDKLLGRYLNKKGAHRDYVWWNEANTLKEHFRRSSFFKLRGSLRDLPLERIGEFLNRLIKRLDHGIKRAHDKKSGLPNTYFLHELKEWRTERDGSITPRRFLAKPIALFLEGPMHLLRLERDAILYDKVKKSVLFDKKLNMYRLNASLANEPLEIGRSRVFPPGWLENESIWLHMEYKYLLEVLKSGLYDDFYRDFFNCAVCFLKPPRYGRSILENSSFIVSSAHFDKKLWGRGFVARLTGATAELLNMWIIMCLGHEPFYTDADNNLYIKFRPLLKGSLFTTKKETVCVAGQRLTIPASSFACKIFSSTLLIYHNSRRKDTFAKGTKIKRIEIRMKDGHIYTIEGDTIVSPLSHRIRNTEARQIDIYFG